ncbi:uncharacterized protein LOC129728792 [Wyeomyia smithii]|uniref:uncharacterized protein LOC129728792 n=1 Tax=Wyeomyia smithii TaxID=174621 RepID=UPI002467E325|nr:uncharacterized protein LOC129728792 [Wyeomyia smithii]
MERILKEKKRQMETKLLEKRLSQERESKKQQLEEERQMLERQLEEEKTFLEERKNMQQEFQAAKQMIAEKYVRQGITLNKDRHEERSMFFGEKIDFWMQKQGENSRHEPKKGVEEQNCIDEIEAEDSDQNSEGSSVVSYHDDVPEKYSTEETRNRNRIRQPTKLSAEHIAARQAISKHLPVFKGEPEVWPIFISSFEFTTEACGFSNLDNLKRLQDSLQGNALEAVSSRLVLPSSVPDVIEDLRRLFGKPEKLLKTLLTKVRNSPAPRADRLDTFIQFGLTVKQLCDHLEAANLKEHLSNPMLVQELVEKLPPNYRLDWVRFKRGKNGTPLRMFTDFMNDIVSDVSEVTEFVPPGVWESSSPSFSKANTKRKEFMHVHNAVSSRTEDHSDIKGVKPCWVCRRTDHKLRFCDDFKRMSLVNRLKVVEKNKLCTLCLNNHGKSTCNFKIRCNVGGCRGGHHPLLHRVEAAVQISNVKCHAHDRIGRSVIFRIAPISLHVGDRVATLLAFFDEGSSATLIEESVAKQLNIKGVAEPLVVTWTGNVRKYENTSVRANVKLSAQGSDTMLPLTNVRTVKQLMLPEQDLQSQELTYRYPHLSNIPVANYERSRPGIIIGLDNLHIFAPLNSRVGPAGEPIAVFTKIGWMIYGPEPRKTTAEVSLNFHSYEAITNERLHDLIREQYVVENLTTPFEGLLESSENQRARAILEATTIRVDDRFETGLLWRADTRHFPDSYPMAVRRLISLEKKLDRDPELFQSVHQQIRDYVTKGYAHKATEKELVESQPNSIWYLPMNVVRNPRKPGKIRFVWDAAATVNGISLNSELLAGPDMLQSLPAVINRFRERRIAFGGDIQEMYHQIRIRSDDKQAQRFLFRSSPNDKPEVYVMDVATFGSTCSPCSAQFIKNINAAEFAEEFPEAAAAVINNHYVDDYYDSADSVDHAYKIAREVKYIHSRGGFHLRNWVSNSSEFLEAMGEPSKNSAVHFNRDKSTMVERVLGIIWDPSEDVFRFSTTVREAYKPVLHGIERPTKRIVLSCVMSMFDPQGLLSPFTVFGRMLIQDLWRTGCDWDDPVDDRSHEKWTRWTKVLPQIAAIKVPRSYFGVSKLSEVKKIQLHIITDASKGALGCVAYFRAIVEGNVRCVLVASRVKVAPLKPVSIPRLELQAAVIGARLASAVRKNHFFDIETQFFWSDSTTVLSWIRSDHRRYKEYVGHRVGEILSISRLPEWKWIPTKLNVADQLTKSTRDPEMNAASTWFNGPDFMYLGEENWPKQRAVQAETEEEIKVHLMIHDVEVPAAVIKVERISKWNILVRTLASVYRFLSNCKRKIKRSPLETLRASLRQANLLKSIKYPVVITPLKQQELGKAEQTLFKMAQIAVFEPEFKILKKNAELPMEKWLKLEKSSLLYKLTPYVGVDYLGPFTVVVNRHSEKRWIVLFTCLVVRAVHLEVAHSLTTQSCLMAIRRFICRRGPPLEFFSDNGTNLKGASKELKANMQAIGEESANEFTSARTKWTFSPPATPHMGGVWERLVRSVKAVLSVLDDGRRLTDEVLLTSITEAEDIVNSRPLVYASQESEEALTPNNFLRGVSPNEPRQGTPPTYPAKALRDSFHRSQQLTEEMWKKLIREYVPSISGRPKWFAESKNLQVGDLVYVVEGKTITSTQLAARDQAKKSPALTLSPGAHQPAERPREQ